MQSRYNVVVIGGGQAGLAIGYHLARRGRDFLILDAGPRVGHAWRTRWRSLTLFTPARFSGLPEMPFPGDPNHMPNKDEVAIVPAIAPDIGEGVVQIHSSEYRDPTQIPDGEVLVVGGGNSGVQIAAELATQRRTWLSVGQTMTRLPDRLLGRSIFWWLDKVGAMDITVDSRLGRRASTKDVLIGQSLRMAARDVGVQIAGRTVRSTGNTIETSDGRTIEPAAVIWATGYRMDFSFIDAPVFDTNGHPLHTRGLTRTPGLYFLGLPWLHTRGSALIGWVGRDAAYIADRIGPAGQRRGVARV